MALEFLDPFIRLLPEVKAPDKKQSLPTKLFWTFLVLALFFIMGKIGLAGLSQTVANAQLQQFQTLLASDIGTILTLGIGPIVLSSIILQLLVGGRFIHLDLSNPEDKARFTGMQKILGILLAFFEAFAYTGFGIFPSLIQPATLGLLAPGYWFVILQIAFGAILLMYLDEVVSKWGIGSGIGLFIAAGVSASFFWQVFQPVTVANPAGGRLLLLLSVLSAGQIASALAILIPILFAVAIFFMIVYAEGIHVNIPLVLGTKNMGGRFPVKFLYVSNMPVILAAALFANIQIWKTLAGSTGIFADILGAIAWATSVPRIDGSLGLVEGLLIKGITSTTFLEIGHGLLFVLVLTILCVIFGRFWVEMGNQGSDAMAEQIDRSGMYIPGFRRDPRIIKGVLDRYIPPITILSSIFVGLLAGFSDIITGSLVSGTGILLTVGIIYRLYEEVAKDTALDSMPMLQQMMQK